MSTQHVDEHYYAYLDDELPDELRATVDAHLQACARCAGELAILRQARAGVRKLPAVAVPPDLTARVRARLLEHRQPAVPFWRQPLWVGGLAAAAGLILVITLSINHQGASSRLARTSSYQPITIEHQPAQPVKTPVPITPKNANRPAVTETDTAPAPEYHPAPEQHPAPEKESVLIARMPDDDEGLKARGLFGTDKPKDPPAPKTDALLVDPVELDGLVTELSVQLEATPELRDRIRAGRLVLLPLARINLPATTVSTGVEEDLTTVLIKRGYAMIERGQAVKTLHELKLPADQAFTPDDLRVLGEKTGCEFLLLGSLTRRTDAVVVNVRLIEAATGKAIAAERRDMHVR